MIDNVNPKRNSARQRLYLISLILAGATGLFVGLVLLVSDTRPHNHAYPFGDGLQGSIGAQWAITACIVMLMGITISTILFHRSVDEQEERAIFWANTIAVYAIITEFSVWYILWLGGLAPRVDAAILIFSGAILGLAGWLWKKYL